VEVRLQWIAGSEGRRREEGNKVQWGGGGRAIGDAENKRYCWTQWLCGGLNPLCRFLLDVKSYQIPVKTSQSEYLLRLFTLN